MASPSNSTSNYSKYEAAVNEFETMQKELNDVKVSHGFLGRRRVTVGGETDSISGWISKWQDKMDALNQAKVENAADYGMAPDVNEKHLDDKLALSVIQAKHHRINLAIIDKLAELNADKGSGFFATIRSAIRGLRDKNNSSISMIRTREENKLALEAFASHTIESLKQKTADKHQEALAEITKQTKVVCGGSGQTAIKLLKDIVNESKRGNSFENLEKQFSSADSNSATITEKYLQAVLEGALDPVDKWSSAELEELSQFLDTQTIYYKKIDKRTKENVSYSLSSLIKDLKLDTAIEAKILNDLQDPANKDKTPSLTTKYLDKRLVALKASDSPDFTSLDGFKNVNIKEYAKKSTITFAEIKHIQTNDPFFNQIKEALDNKKFLKVLSGQDLSLEEKNQVFDDLNKRAVFIDVVNEKLKDNNRTYQQKFMAPLLTNLFSELEDKVEDFEKTKSILIAFKQAGVSVDYKSLKLEAKFTNAPEAVDQFLKEQYIENKIVDPKAKPAFTLDLNDSESLNAFMKVVEDKSQSLDEEQKKDLYTEIIKDYFMDYSMDYSHMIDNLHVVLTAFDPILKNNNILIDYKKLDLETWLQDHFDYINGTEVKGLLRNNYLDNKINNKLTAVPSFPVEDSDIDELFINLIENSNYVAKNPEEKKVINENVLSDIFGGLHLQDDQQSKELVIAKLSKLKELGFGVDVKNLNLPFTQSTLGIIDKLVYGPPPQTTSTT